jgi:hypothetical protein
VLDVEAPARPTSAVSSEREADLLRQFDEIIGPGWQARLALIVADVQAARENAAKGWPSVATAQAGMEDFADDLAKVNRYIEMGLLAKASRIGLATDNKFHPAPHGQIESTDQRRLEALATHLLPQLKELRRLAATMASVKIEKKDARVPVNVVERGSPERECCALCALLLDEAGQEPRSHSGGNLERLAAIAWELATGEVRDFDSHARAVVDQWKKSKE